MAFGNALVRDICEITPSSSQGRSPAGFPRQSDNHRNHHGGTNGDNGRFAGVTK